MQGMPLLRLGCALLSSLVLQACGGDGESTSAVAVAPIVQAPVNQAPVARAGVDREVTKGSVVTLDATLSTDADGDPITYRWLQTDGLAVVLSSANASRPTFTAPVHSGVLRFVLVANDGKADSATVGVNIFVENRVPQLGFALLSPRSPRTSDAITVAVTPSDADGEPLQVSYEWQRNGQVVAGQTSATFPASLTTKNDVIYVRVLASDGEAVAASFASTTILDSPTTVLGALPTTLTKGSTLQTALVATDDDGDAVGNFELVYGPAGFAVTTGGQVTWTPSGPLFDRSTDFRWAIRTPVSSVPLTGTIRLEDPARAQPLRRVSMPVPQGQRDIRVGDFDGNGSREMLILGSDSLAEVKRMGSGYVEQWVYPFVLRSGVPAQPGAFAAGDVDGDGKAEIFMASAPLGAGYALVKLDGRNRREVARYDATGFSNLTGCYSMELADLDRNGTLELIAVCAGTLVVLDPVSMAVKFTRSIGIGDPVQQNWYKMAIGNVDADPALEIILTQGFVFDGATGGEQFSSNGFGDQIAVGDVDGDGMGEIIGVFRDKLRAFSAVTRTMLWEIQATALPQVGTELGSLLVTDLDSDGLPDLVVGPYAAGNIVGIKYNSLAHSYQELFRVAAQTSAVSALAYGDLDADGFADLAWGAGVRTTANDLLAVASLNPVGLQWSSASEPRLDSGFSGGGKATIAAGQIRLLFAAPRSNETKSGLRVAALNPATGLFTVGSELGSNTAASASIAVADYDGDAVDEAFLCSAANLDGYFIAYDVAADASDWSSAPVSNEHCSAIRRADVTGDGRPDLIAITNLGYLYVFDVFNQALIWKSASLAGQGLDLEVSDLDQDGRPELIAATSSRVVTYRRASAAASPYVEVSSVSSDPIRDLLVADTDTNGSAEVYTLVDSGVIQVYDALLRPLRTLAALDVSSLHLEESATARKNLLVGAGEPGSSASSHLRAIDPVSGSEVWRSPQLAGVVARNSVQFVDTDGDGEKELSFATSRGMYLTR
jgi:hypothetical protein